MHFDIIINEHSNFIITKCTILLIKMFGFMVLTSNYLEFTYLQGE